jgi:hypothetical protein
MFHNNISKYGAPQHRNLTVHLLISIPETDKMAVLAPSTGRPDHRITHPMIFSYGDIEKVSVPNSGVRHPRF